MLFYGWLVPFSSCSWHSCRCSSCHYALWGRHLWHDLGRQFAYLASDHPASWSLGWGYCHRLCLHPVIISDSGLQMPSLLVIVSPCPLRILMFGSSLFSIYKVAKVLSSFGLRLIRIYRVWRACSIPLLVETPLWTRLLKRWYTDTKLPPLCTKLVCGLNLGRSKFDIRLIHSIFTLLLLPLVWSKIFQFSLWHLCHLFLRVLLGLPFPLCSLGTVFTRALSARSLIGFVLCNGLRVAPQALSVTSLGLSCFFGGPLIPVLCPHFGSMVVGCVLGTTRRPFVVSHRRIRFFVLGVVRCHSFYALGRWYLVCQSRPFLLPFLGLLGVLARRWGYVRIWLCSFLRFGLFTRCVYPPCSELFVGLMARNPASYVSCLTLVTRRMCEWGKIWLLTSFPLFLVKLVFF